MFGSALLFLDWRFSFLNSKLKTKQIQITSSQETLIQYLLNPLFIFLTLFLSFLLLAVSYLPTIWFPWILYLTGKNLELSE